MLRPILREGRAVKLETRLCSLLGIQYPIVQAPIGGASTPELAAAVSNAGALGTLSITWRAMSDVTNLLRRLANLTDRPFGANVVLEWPQEERISLALEAGARIVWTFWGDARPHVGRIKEAGAFSIHTVGSAEEAKEAAAAGVDIVVAQGVEAGGHLRGTLPWKKLLTRVLERVPDLPVLVAGGIADGRDMALAISAGAAGVVLRTRFVCSSESSAAPAYQKAISDAKDGDTLLTSVFDKGWPNAPHRVLRNSTVRMWESAGRPQSGARPGEHDEVAVGPDGSAIERYSAVLPTTSLSGDHEALALFAGETSARIGDVKPASAIVEQLVREATEA